MKWPLIIIGVIFLGIALVGIITGERIFITLVMAGCMFLYGPMMGAEGNGWLRSLLEKFTAQVQQDIVPKPPYAKMTLAVLMAGMPFYPFWEFSALLLFLPGGKFGWLIMAAPVGIVSLVRMNRTKMYWKEMDGRTWLFWGLQITIYLLMLLITALVYKL